MTMRLATRPNPIDWEPRETALVVVDMQNGFCMPGGYLDLVGYDVTGAQQVIAAIGALLPAVRAAGMPVVYLQSGFDPLYRVVGGPTAPVWHKSEAIVLMRERPELHGKLITRGGWDYEIVDALEPRPEDILVRKSRYSGFAGTDLDQQIRARRIRNLIFTGVATNICVETTLREAYSREYFVLLLEDATMQAGEPAMKQATLINVERYFGWVCGSTVLRNALAPARATADRA
jgi:ureidoacrylate peracid hydrolase